MKSKDFRTKAREALSGNWVISIIVSLVAMLLGAGSGVGHPGSASGTSGAKSDTSLRNTIENMDVSPVIITITVALLFLLFIYLIVVLVFGGATKLGLIAYNIDLVSKRNAPAFATLFSRYRYFLKALLLQLVMFGFIFLWTLLFIIPGIIAAYRYAMAPYLMSEDPDIGVMDAISRSKELMNGNKLRLFLLELSFIGWHLLSALTFGIGYLFLNPYIAASEAAFYLDLTGGSSISSPSVDQQYAGI